MRHEPMAEWMELLARRREFAFSYRGHLPWRALDDCFGRSDPLCNSRTCIMGVQMDRCSGPERWLCHEPREYHQGISE